MSYASVSSASAQKAHAANVTISGAGSTFAAPVYAQWGSLYHTATINYNPTGSGSGVTSIQNNLVDFAGDDPPLAAADIAGAKGPLLDFPMFLGAITISYHLPGIGSGLQLDGTSIANIYLGKITMWNDPAIVKLNPKLKSKLPAHPIVVVHRSDSSGTTASFTTFLAATSPTWANTPGDGTANKAPNWPAGSIGGKGNSGVAQTMQSNVYSIAYVEQSYALQSKFTVAAVKNAAGKFVLPTLASTSIAGQGFTPPANLEFTVVYVSKNKKAYPITSQSFIVVYKDMCKVGAPGGQAAASATKAFINYGLTGGQKTLKVGDYAALPSNIQKLSIKQLSQLQCNGAPLK
jgi:phosphate transport system substrate-binding protein